MVCTDVPHIVLHVSCQTRTSGGIFGPLKSDLGVFWPFRGPDFIMGKNKNANFSKRARCPIFKFCVVIREAILQKMAPILDPVNFFSFLTLLGHCALGLVILVGCLQVGWSVGFRPRNWSRQPLVVPGVACCVVQATSSLPVLGFVYNLPSPSSSTSLSSGHGVSTYKTKAD